MKAAVVTDFALPPRYAEFRAAAATSGHEIVVDVIAAGLHPRVRSQADGSHYTSTGELPFVPGIGAREILAELPDLAREISRGAFAIDARTMPLADVERAWAAPARERIVFVPRP